MAADKKPKEEEAADVAEPETKSATATETTRRRRSGGRAAKKTTTPETKSAPSPRRRASAEPVSPAAAAAAEEHAATLLEHQATLLERQNVLLESLVEQQQQMLQELKRTPLLQSNGQHLSGDLALEVKPRLAIFVDVPNILYGAERSGVTLDWGKIADFLARGRTLVRAVAYAPISDDPAARQENERFVVPFVDKDYRIVTKPLKRFSGGGVKANFDVELAIDILTMADRLDVIALVSGDGDFRRLVEIVGSHGVRVEVVAFGHSTSMDLRQVADRYVDIAAYVPEFSVS